MTKRMLVFTCRIAAAAALVVVLAPPPAVTDETCNSPYIANLIKGQEDYVYVWALGVEGLGDGSDKLVTVDVNPTSKTYGKVLHQAAVGTRGEAHHMGFTDDRRRIWAGGLAGSDIYVFDIATDPARPKLVKTIKDLAKKTGYIGPHTYYALPGRMVVQALSNEKDKGGVTGMAVYNNNGDFIASHPMPVGNGGDGYGYDLAVNPKKNVMLTSSFTGYANYMRPLGELIKDEAAMKRFGNTMVVWDLKAMKPQQILAVPGAPLEIRWSLDPGENWADHRRRPDLQALAGGAGRRRSVAGEGSGHDRRPGEDPPARGHQHHPRRQGTLGEHVHGRHDALLRSVEPARAEADLREADRPAGQHDLAELGRNAGLHHVFAARQLGQGRRRQRAVPARVHLGRQGAEAGLRGGLHPREARARPPHEAGLEGAAHRLCRADRPLAPAAGPSG